MEKLNKLWTELLLPVMTKDSFKAGDVSFLASAASDPGGALYSTLEFSNRPGRFTNALVVCDYGVRAEELASQVAVDRCALLLAGRMQLSKQSADCNYTEWCSDQTSTRVRSVRVDLDPSDVRGWDFDKLLFWCLSPAQEAWARRAVEALSACQPTHTL